MIRQKNEKMKNSQYIILLYSRIKPNPVLYRVEISMPNANVFIEFNKPPKVSIT